MATLTKIAAPLNGSSLIEVLVSMVLIALSISIGLLVFMNVIYSSDDQLKLKAQFALNEFKSEMYQEKSYFTEEEEFEGILISKEIADYNGIGDLKRITLIARSGSRDLIRQELIVRVDEAD